MEWKTEYRNALLDMSTNPPNVRDIINPHIPLKLYKYGSFQSPYWGKVIYKGEIHLSQAKCFNDPFDCKARFNYHEAIKKGDFRDKLFSTYLGRDFENIPEEIIQNYAVEGLRKDIYVFCFSEVWDSLLMWAHYANNYNGFCVEYDMSEVSDRIIDKLYPVLYEKDYIDVTSRLINFNENVGLICNLSKAEEWSYEREWRIVDYSYQSFYLRKALKTVYLGKNCEKNIQKEIIAWAKEKGKKIYSVQASNTEYKLERHREI